MGKKKDVGETKTGPEKTAPEKRTARRGLPPPLAFMLALSLLAALFHWQGNAPPTADRRPQAVAASSAPPPDKRYTQAKKGITELRLESVRRPGRTGLREAWARLADEFLAIYEQYPQWSNRPAALFRMAESLEEIARNSSDIRDAEAAVARYEELAAKHPHNRLADDALYNAALLRASRMGDSQGALATVSLQKQRYPQGDMLPAALSLEKNLLAARAAKAPAVITPERRGNDSRPEKTATESGKSASRKNAKEPVAQGPPMTKEEPAVKEPAAAKQNSAAKPQQAALTAEKTPVLKADAAPSATESEKRAPENATRPTAQETPAAKEEQVKEEPAVKAPPAVKQDAAAKPQQAAPVAEKAPTVAAGKTDAAAVTESEKRAPENTAGPTAQETPAAKKTPVAPEQASVKVQAAVKIQTDIKNQTAVKPEQGPTAEKIPSAATAGPPRSPAETTAKTAPQGKTLAGLRLAPPAAGPHTPMKAAHQDRQDRELTEAQAPNGGPGAKRGALAAAPDRAELPPLPKSPEAKTRRADSAARAKTGQTKPNLTRADLGRLTLADMAGQLGLTVSRVFIDAGHGGKDPGASANGVLERSLTLEVAMTLARLLEAGGLEVVNSRTGNSGLSLSERNARANAVGADLFVSIHINANTDPSVSGLEIYYLNFASSPEAARVAALENAAGGRRLGEMQRLMSEVMLNARLEESRRLAGDIRQQTVSRLRLRDFSTRDNGVKAAPFHVLIGAQMPAVLVELGYCTNRAEAARLLSPTYRQTLAEGLAAGILTYRNRLDREGMRAALEKRPDSQF